MRDFFNECNNMGVPEEDFRRIWCIRCVQPECHRSHKGKSRFEARVSTWEERLFTGVPRMPETDPRYHVLASQKFEESQRPVQVQVPANLDSGVGTLAEPLPSGFVMSRVPNQSGKVLGGNIVQPGARIRLGGNQNGGVG